VGSFFLRIVENRKWIKFLVFLFVAIDVFYSFYQYFLAPFDGDFSGGVLPDSELLPLFSDPFGFKVIFTEGGHANPNRYFSHYLFYSYFGLMPSFLEQFFNPVDSLYLSAALLKIAVHVSFIIVLTKLMKRVLPNVSIYIFVLVIVVLLQQNGYGRYICLVDKSISYLFFYGLPLLGVCVAILLWFNRSHRGGAFWITISILVAILSFSGPLAAPVLCIFFSMVLVKLVKEKKLNHQELLFIFWTLFCGMYSFILGFRNTVYFEEVLSLSGRYSVLPKGLWYMLTQRPWFFIILFQFMIFIFFRGLKRKDVSVISWVVIGVFLYLILLPLGGYRPYRPNIIRFDTFAPVLVCILIGVGVLEHKLFFLIYKKNRILAVGNLLLFLFVFQNADHLPRNTNKTEREDLTRIINSNCSICEVQSPFFGWKGQLKDDFSRDVKALKKIGVLEKDIVIKRRERN